MRPSSVYSTRSSQASSLASQAANSQFKAKFLEKIKELDALFALEHATASYVRRLEGVSTDCDVMADAGKVHGEVLAHWPEMFRILGLFTQARQGQLEETQDPASAGERLVRVPIEELQQQQQEGTQRHKL